MISSLSASFHIKSTHVYWLPVMEIKDAIEDRTELHRSELNQFQVIYLTIMNALTLTSKKLFTGCSNWAAGGLRSPFLFLVLLHIRKTNSYLDWADPFHSSSLSISTSVRKAVIFLCLYSVFNGKPVTYNSLPPTLCPTVVEFAREIFWQCRQQMTLKKVNRTYQVAGYFDS